MEGSRRSRVKGSSLLQDRRSTSSAGCSVQRVLAVLRDFSTTDFEGSGLGMQQAKHIPPHTRQGCRRTAREAMASLRPDSGTPRLAPAAPCALPCWQSGLLRSPEVDPGSRTCWRASKGEPSEVNPHGERIVCNNQAACNMHALTGLTSLIWQMDKTVQERK